MQQEAKQAPTFADVYTKFINCIFDDETAVKRVSRKAIQEVSKQNPQYFVDFVVDRLSNFSGFRTEEDLRAYFELLRESFSFLDESVFKEKSKKIYQMFLKLIQKVVKAPQGYDKNYDLVHSSEDAILQIIGEFGKFNPEDNVSFALAFLTNTGIPPEFIFKLIINTCRLFPNQIFGFLPEILTKIVATMPRDRDDEPKKLYVELLFNLCDIYTIVLENNEQAINIIDNISQIMASILDVVLNEWMNSRDAMLRISCLKLLGSISSIIPKKKLLTNAEALIGIYLNAIKRESRSEVYKVIEGLNVLLERVIKLDRGVIGSYQSTILVALHPLTLLPIMSVNAGFDAASLKLKNSILNCLQILSTTFPDATFDFYLSKLDTKNVTEKACVLWVIRQLLSRNADAISPNLKSVMVSHFNNMVTETDFEIRFVLCEIVMAFVTSGAINDTENSKSLLEYLLKQVSTHPKEIQDMGDFKSEGFETTLDIVVNRAQQIYTQLCNDKQGYKFIWPNVLGTIMNTAYSPGVPAILKPLSGMILKNIDELRTISIEPIVGRPQNVLLRLILLAFVPHVFPNLGSEILSFLPNYLAVLNIPATGVTYQDCLIYIKTGKDTENPAYVDKVHMVLNAILNNVRDERWMMELFDATKDAMTTYASSDLLKKHLIEVQGFTISKIQRSETVRVSIEKIFCLYHPEFHNNALHAALAPETPNEEMRVTVAQTLGIIAQNHMEYVIEFIKFVFQCEAAVAKKGGLMSFFGGQGANNALVENVRLTLIMSIGYVSKYAHPDDFIKKFENSFVNILLPYLEDHRSYNYKLYTLRSLTFIGRSLFKLFEYQTEISEDFKMFVVRQREKIIERSENILRSPDKNNTNELRAAAINTLALFSKLDPALHKSFYDDLLQDSLNILSKEDAENSLSIYWEATENIIQTMLHFNSLRQLEGENIHIIPWFKTLIQIQETTLTFVKKNPDEAIQIELRSYISNIFVRTLNQKKMAFPKPEEKRDFLNILMEFVSQIYLEDNDLAKSAMLCIHKILLAIGHYEDLRFTGVGQLHKDLLGALETKMDAALIIPEIVQIILTNLIFRPKKILLGLINFLEQIQEKYYVIIKPTQDVILQIIFENLDEASLFPPEHATLVEDELLNFVLKLLKKNHSDILNILLKRKPEFPLPLGMAKCLQKIIKDKTLLLKTFNYLTDILNNPEQVSFEPINIMMFNATIFIGVIMEAKDETLTNLTKKFFYQILATFIIRFATSFDYLETDNNPLEKEAPNFTLWSFQHFLECVEEKYLLQSIECGGLPQKLVHSDFQDGIAELLLIISKNAKLENLKTLVDFMLPFLGKKIDSQKFSVLIVLSNIVYTSTLVPEFTDEDIELSFNIASYRQWIYQMVEMCLPYIEHKEEQFRLHAYKSAGNLYFVHKLKDNSKVQIKDHEMSPSIIEQSPLYREQELKPEFVEILLTSLMRGLNESSTLCLRECLGSFQRILELFDPESIKSYIPELNFRIRTSFENSDAKIRMLAFTFYGKALVNVYGDSNIEDEALLEQVHHNLISLFLHINDYSESARQASILALQDLSRVISQPDLAKILEEGGSDDVLNKELFDRNERELYKIAQFVYVRLPAKFNDFVMFSREFIKSSDENIRASAIFFLLCCQKVGEATLKIDTFALLEVLNQCLLDKNDKVRMKTIKGYSFLCHLFKTN